MSEKAWVTQGFDAFRQGTFGNGGQNLYVSKQGVLQRIFQYDLNHNGYVDLVFANCQNHGESAPSYVYNANGTRDLLPGQGSVCSMVLDIDADGYEDIVVTGFYDMAAPYASTDIYFGSPEGYSEKYHIRIPTPFACDCCHGDFNGSGRPTLAFALPKQRCVRLFTPTENGCLEWTEYTDFPIAQLGTEELGEYAANSHLICAADLDGDGYDELIHREEGLTQTTIYWGGPQGLDPNRKTVLPELPAEEVLAPREEPTLQSETEKEFKPPRLLQKVCWNGRTCFTLSTGKKMLFYSADAKRQPECVLAFEVPMARAVAVGDLDGDGYDDIAVAAIATNPQPGYQSSFILWNGPEGLDKRPRTVIPTRSACHVDLLEDMVLFCQCNSGNLYTNDALLFTYPNFKEPQKFEGEDPRRCALIHNPDGVLRVFLNNHFSRSSIGYDRSYIYWGGPEGYSPENMQAVPSHCAVDALVVDFNDDGWAELLVANNSENSLHLDPGHHMHFFGPNGFEPEKSFTLKTNVGWGVVAGDFNHDGYLEVITPAGNEQGPWRQLRMFSAKDRFKTYTEIALPEDATGRWPTAVDLNNNGWLDLIVPTSLHKNALIYWGGPEGFSLERSTKLATYFPIGATAADLTKNGYPDLIIGCHTNTTPKPCDPHHSFVHIYWNGPEGISESRKCVLRGDAADHMVVADFNGDGWLDLFAGSYHGGKDRDINSFLYWNRQGRFSELDRELLYTHSASGCMAADFNEDGYIDLAVANHKVDGDHHGYSTVWWNGASGFNPANVTHLPTNGPHGMISTEIGNILDRSFSEYYYSAPYTVTEACQVAEATAEGELPPKTAAHILLRVNGGPWVEPQGLRLAKGDILEYRLELYAYNGLRTPRINKVTVAFKA